MVKAIYDPPLRAGALSRLVAGTRTFSPLCDATAFKAVVVHSEGLVRELPDTELLFAAATRGT